MTFGFFSCNCQNVFVRLLKNTKIVKQFFSWSLFKLFNLIYDWKCDFLHALLFVMLQLNQSVTVSFFLFFVEKFIEFSYMSSPFPQVLIWPIMKTKRLHPLAETANLNSHVRCQLDLNLTSWLRCKTVKSDNSLSSRQFIIDTFLKTACLLYKHALNQTVH